MRKAKLTNDLAKEKASSKVRGKAATISDLFSFRGSRAFCNIRRCPVLRVTTLGPEGPSFCSRKRLVPASGRLIGSIHRPSFLGRKSADSVAFCWTAKPPTAGHNFSMLISRAGRRCSSRYSRYGVSTSSIHFMNARTRRDRLLRYAVTRDTASARRRKPGMT